MGGLPVLTVNCPQCGTKYEYEKSDVGKPFACPCGKQLTLPNGNSGCKTASGVLAVIGVILGLLAFVLFFGMRSTQIGNENPGALFGVLAIVGLTLIAGIGSALCLAVAFALFMTAQSSHA
jgi:hypothetical protein